MNSEPPVGVVHFDTPTIRNMLSQLRRRVVVTGLGICSPLGTKVSLVWKKLLEGQSGIRSLPDEIQGIDYSMLPCQVAGLIPRGSNPGEFNQADHVSKSEKKTMGSDSVFALACAEEALQDAKWFPQTEQERIATGVSVGSAGSSEAEMFFTANEHLRLGQYRKISPYMIPSLLPNMSAGNISLRYMLKGPNHSVCTACAAGTHSIGDAACMIARGVCEVMVAGASEGVLHPAILAGFCRAQALCTKFNHDPLRASRPFDLKRAGFVPSEGAGVLILEEIEHAMKRKANIYAEILGYGMSGDAYHLTAPDPDGNGAQRAMKAAMNDAGLQPEAVGHINVHATSTRLGDAAENNAVKKVFGDHSCNLLIYAPKGALGHLQGAAGAVEAILTVLSVKEGVIPPNLNLEEKEPEFDLKYVTGEPAQWNTEGGKRRIALINSFGFGGTNASLCIGEY